MGSNRNQYRTAGSRTAASLLFAFVLAVAISPRIRLIGGETTADIRLQDLLLIPVVAYLFIARRKDSSRPIRAVTRWLVPVVALLAGVVTAASIILMPEIPLVRRVAFYGRGMELFVIATSIAGLWLRADARALPSLSRSVYVGAGLNMIWVAYQFATGTVGTLLGNAVSETVESYGPKLVGEPSAFGTGQYFAAVAAFGIAQLRVRAGNRPAAIALLAVGTLGAYLANSRISLGAILLAALLLVILGRGRALLNPFAVTITALIGAVGALLIIPHLTGRLSANGIEAGVGVRANGIWDVAWRASLENPLLGVGPGGLVAPLPIEAHNIYIRAVADYGLIVGPLFITVFVVVLVAALRQIREPGVPDTIAVVSNWAFFVLLSVLVSGTVQDALTGVMSSHLAAIAFGVFAAASVSRHRDPAISNVRQQRRGRVLNQHWNHVSCAPCLTRDRHQAKAHE